jgi:uncharacterized protein YPO0396
MVLKRKKIKFNKGEKKQVSEEEYEKIKSEISGIKEKANNTFNPENLEEKTENYDSEKQSDADNVVLQMITEKKEQLSQDKNELMSLETKIKKGCSEIEALEYIASGEPTMSIMDLLNMLQDFCNDAEKYEDAISLLEEMEQTILKSTIQSIKG